MEVDHSIAPTISMPETAATLSTSANDEFHGSAGTLGAMELDRATVAYVVASRKHFDRLRQATGQLAGLLVLAASGVNSITPEHAVLAAARAAYAEAAANIRCIGVPERARHQHHHLLLAVDLIGVALQHCGSEIAAYAINRRNIDDALHPLQRGYAHLQQAAALLPGFEVIAFAQGCCASHPAVMNPPATSVIKSNKD